MRSTDKDVCIFVDSRAALDSLSSRSPVYAEILLLCKVLLRKMEVTFYLIPSHVGIPQNEKADVLAKCRSQRDEIDVMCYLSIPQSRNMVRKEQYCIDRDRMMRKHINRDTFKHFDTFSDCVAVTDGKDGTLIDEVKMRWMLESKYYWQYKDLFTIEEARCRVCGNKNGYTFEHHVLRCSCVEKKFFFSF